MTNFIKLILSAICLIELAGCASGLNTVFPTMVGQKDGIPLYSITGRSAFGETTKEDAIKRANEDLQPLCADKIHIVNFQTYPIPNHIGWSATYTCAKPTR